MVLGKAVHLRVPLGGGQRLQSQPLLKTNDAVLHFERIAAQFDEGDEGRYRQSEKPGGRNTSMVPKVEDGEDYVGEQKKGQDKVIRRIEAAMFLEVLRR